MRIALLAAASVALLMPASAAAIIDNYVAGDDRVFDLDHNGRLDAKELAVKALHESPKTSDLYNAIDVIRIDGVFDAQELAQYYATSRQQSAKALDPLLKQVGKPATEKAGIIINDLHAAEGALRCSGGQGVYIRHDQFDVGVYAKSLSAGSAQGASFKIAQDLAANSTAASIHGFATAVIYRNPCLKPPGGDANSPFVSGYVLAPWIFANGNIGGTGKTPASTLQLGVNSEVEVLGRTSSICSTTLCRLTFRPTSRTRAAFSVDRRPGRLTVSTGISTPLPRSEHHSTTTGRPTCLPTFAMWTTPATAASRPTPATDGSAVTSA